MIEGTKVADDFEKIYATSFYYNDNDVAVWPAQVVNYTNKTQFLFRIEKGVLDINDPGVNDSFDPSEIRVPFRNMIYIGDMDFGPMQSEALTLKYIPQLIRLKTFLQKQYGISVLENIDKYPLDLDTSLVSFYEKILFVLLHSKPGSR